MHEHRMDAVPEMSLLAEELFFGQCFSDGEVALVRPVVVVIKIGEVVLQVHGNTLFMLNHNKLCSYLPLPISNLLQIYLPISSQYFCKLVSFQLGVGGAVASLNLFKS